MKERRGFTLIELLIVAAIIAILAGIALPNFLEAQVRSKVAVAKTNVRTLAMAVEAYANDNNGHYPPSMFSNSKVMPITRQHAFLTTPIAYVTSGEMFQDPFRTDRAPYRDQQGTVNDFAFPATYGAVQYYGSESMANGKRNTSAYVAHEIAFRRHRYLFASRGPDGTWSNMRGVFTTGNGNATDYLYDPTNGTLSDCDIPRTSTFSY